MGIQSQSKGEIEGTNNSVQQYIGTAYDNVQCVTDNMPYIVKVSQGDISPILESPSGCKYCIVVDDNGVLSTCDITSETCYGN